MKAILTFSLFLFCFYALLFTFLTGSDADLDNSDASFFQTLDERIVQTTAFLKSLDIGTIQVGMIFTRSDFRIIQIIDINQRCDVLSDSDIRCGI